MEDNRALQARDLLIGFHSEAWNIQNIENGIRDKATYCRFAILKYHVFREVPTYKVNSLRFKDYFLYYSEFKGFEMHKLVAYLHFLMV